MAYNISIATVMHIHIMAISYGTPLYNWVVGL